MEQLWNLDAGGAVRVHNSKAVSLLAGKSVFLPPKKWTAVYLPYRMTAEGGVTIACGLCRAGLVSGLAVTKGGQLRVQVWNSGDEAVQLTAKTVMVNVMGAEVWIKRLGKGPRKVNAVQGEKDVPPLGVASGTQEAIHGESNVPGSAILEGPRSITGGDIKDRVMKAYPRVGDLSTHPVNDRMATLEVKAKEVSWREPPESGIRTQYAVERVADRRQIAKQLDEYVQRGYLEEVPVNEKIYMSPLLPVRKPNGTFRFTNDFRKLNSYFSHAGTAQVDAWRKLWEVDPSWKYFMEIDLKDGFFGVPVEEELSRMFEFTFGTRRFRWVRLLQG